MEGVASEVSMKIRSAIKAKLVELGTYVDEELPDYIMVLVANKKTKDQMDDDLSLFLGHNTERFTSWLHHVLQKLNAAALLQVTTQPDEPKKKETEEDKKKLKEEEKRREKDEAKKREKAEEMKKVKDEEKKKNKEKDKIEKKKKLDRKEKNLKVDSVDEDISEKGKKNKEREREGKEKIKITIENDPGDPDIVEGVDSGLASAASVNVSKKLKPLSRGKVSSADIFRAEVADGKDEDEEPVDDMLELRPEVDELGLELAEEEPTPKKSKSEQRKKIIAPRASKDGLEMESRIESKSKKSKHSSPSTRLSAKERLGRVSPSRSEQSKEKPSVLDRLGTTNSSSRRIINLREESSFPPRSESSSGGSNSGLARAVSSAISSAQRSVCVLPSSASSGKKLEARVRPLMSKHIESSREEVTREGSSRSNSSRVVSAVGAVLKRPHKEVESDDEEYDPKKPMLSSMASKVEVIPRPRRSGAIQANTALILRAMADAHKSVNKPSRRHSEKSESPKKKQKGELFTRGYRERERDQARQKDLPEKEDIKLRKIAITVPNATRKESEKQQQEESMIMSEIGNVVAKPLEKRKLERPVLMEEEYELVEPVTSVDYDVEEMEDIEEGEIDDSMSDQPLPPSHRTVPLLSRDKTKFIVTLEGLDAEGYPVRAERPDIRSRLGARPVHSDSLEEVEEYIEEVEEWEEMDEASSETNRDMTVGGGMSDSGKPKLKNTITALPASGAGAKKPEVERCKFWPACKAGDACPYHHPTVPCQNFPNCRFADKCRYVHPKCMYDAACTKPSCPYAHTAPRNTGLIAATIKHKLVVPSRPAKIKCKFFPKCTNMSCPFFHPKACFYGTSCNQANCPYTHPEIPTGAKLKWIAPPKTTTSTVTSVATAENKPVEELSKE